MSKLPTPVSDSAISRSPASVKPSAVGRHTPTPWAYASPLRIDDAEGNSVAHLHCTQGKFEREEDNALHIIKCVNAFDELVEALRPFANYTCCSPAGCDCVACRARAALAKAGVT